MARKRATRDNVVMLENALAANGAAMREGPQRKTWSRHDIKHLTPLTPTQRDMIHEFVNGNNVIAYGSAGTGKSFLSIYLALSEVFRHDSDFNKIIIVRSAVQTREMGHTPGTAEEKAAMYELPYAPIFSELIGRKSTYQDMKSAGVIEFHTTSFVRGVTWDDAIVIVDEVQSMSFHEINTIMTRLGTNSRIILCGDIKQNDLRYRKGDTSGMPKLLSVAKRMKQVSLVQFTKDDIVRSAFVKSWICAIEEDDEDNPS